MYSSVYHTINDGINPSVYFKWEIFFFCAQFLFVKPSANVFFMLLADIAMDGGITDGRILSVRMSVKINYRQTLNHIPTEYFRR